MSEKEKECLFCRVVGAAADQDNFVLYRGSHSFVIINLYPYNNGHLMVVPNRHLQQLTDLTAEERAEIMLLLCQCERILGLCYRPEGFNAGLNLGQVAGAGIIYHLHFHILPRWNGDTNFMGVIGGTRVVPENPTGIYQRLKPHFEKLIPGT